MKTKISYLFLLVMLLPSASFGQKQLDTKDFKKHTTYFNLTDNHELPKQIRSKLKYEISKAQFIGLAEIHQSQQLSFFTKGLLQILSEACFNNFAMEVGPYSAEIIEDLSEKPNQTRQNINKLNRKYSDGEFPKIPLIFVDKKEDSNFLKESARLNFNIWGLDQEYAYSYEMHLDKIYSLINNKTSKIKTLYLDSKKVLGSSIFKGNVDGVTKNCYLKNNPTLLSFFKEVERDKSLKEYTDALRLSLDIYCQQETGKGGSQQRADYMKENFEKKYLEATVKEKFPKVFLKLGSVHLTHSTSPYGINDIGKYLTEKSMRNETKFLNFYHLRRYKDGKDLIDKNGWKDIGVILELGKENKWALIDLKEIRDKVNNGELITTDQISYGLNAYDYALISPDDSNGILNY